MKLRDLRENRNLWLLTCFTIYAVFFFVFAGIYYSIFKANPRSFLFNSDMTRSKASAFTAPVDDEISKETASINAYREFLICPSRIRNYESSEGKGRELIFVIRMHSVSIRAIKHGSDPLKGSYSWTIGLGNNSEIFESLDLNAMAHYLSQSENLEEFHRFMNLQISRLEVDLVRSQSRLEELQSHTTQIWSYWDFFYFSVITQTTVGYGDILPNSTTVRMTVTTQLIIGLIILTFLISFSFRRRKF
jgi:hypothetical protein